MLNGGVLLTIFLLVDISKSVLLSWSHANKTVSPSDFNVIFFKDILCMCVGFCWLLYHHSYHTIPLLQKNSSLFRIYLPISLLFVCSQNCAFGALQLIDIGTFKLLLQACTPVTAILSYYLLFRIFNKREIYAICMVFVFSIVFYMVKFFVIEPTHYNSLLWGILYAIGFIISSSLGGVVSEKVLKTHDSSLAVQYVYSKIASVCISAFIFFINNSSNNFFANFDYRTILVVIEYGISGFIVTAITKYISSTAKNITQAASAAVAQLLTIVFASFAPNTIQTESQSNVSLSNSNPFILICAAGIIASVVYFHISSQHHIRTNECELTDLENRPSE